MREAAMAGILQVLKIVYKNETMMIAKLVHFLVCTREAADAGKLFEISLVNGREQIAYRHSLLSDKLC